MRTSRPGTPTGFPTHNRTSTDRGETEPLLPRSGTVATGVTQARDALSMGGLNLSRSLSMGARSYRGPDG